MIKFSKLTIRIALTLTAIGIFIILAIIGVITEVYVQNAFRYNKALNLMIEISHIELELRKAEKDFILRETSNPEFFETGESKFVDVFSAKIENIMSDIKIIQEYKFISNLGLDKDFNLLESQFKNYNEHFYKLVNAYKEMGFIKTGLIGKMRNHIHIVENGIDQQENLALKAQMLMLRRHEKDFLLRKDAVYQDYFNRDFNKMIREISTFDLDSKDSLVKNLREYQESFFLVVQKSVEIGLTDYHGLSREMNNDIDRIEKILIRNKDIIEKESQAAVRRAIITLIVVSVLLACFIIWLLLKVSKYINKSIKHLQKYITRLGHGELPDKIVFKKDDEIGDMIKSINVLTQNLKNTRDFAFEVGRGNLETQINVFNNQGDLGGALVEMRNRLFQVSQEREDAHLDSQKRTWIAEGAAKFGEILRKNNDDMEEFAFQALSSLVAYIEVNQGVMYVINDNDQNNTFYELFASVAAGKRKFMKKKIILGEDLVGQSVQERRTIYMTEIPKDYFEISSGLGKVKPQSLLIVPLMLHDNILGIIEMASLSEIEQYKIDFVERVGKDIASTISAVKISQKTNSLLKEMQKQAQKLSEQEEELRQNIEELTALQEEANRKELEVKGILQALQTTFLVLEFDMDGIIIEANDAFLQFFGVSKNNCLGRSFVDFTNRNKKVEEYKKFWHELRQGRVIVDIQKITHPNGNTYYLSDTYTPVLDKEGVPSKIINIAIDVTENKKNEEEVIRQSKELQIQANENKILYEELKLSYEETEKREKLLNMTLSETYKTIANMKKRIRKLKKNEEQTINEK